MSTVPLLTDEQWARIEPLLPPLKGAMGKPMRPHRPVVEGAIYRLKAGIPWRYLPAQYGAWQTVHRRHHKWSTDGTWDRVLAQLQAEADARGELDWRVSRGLHHCSSASARRDRCEAGVGAVVAHRGLVRMTRSRRSGGTNRTITPSAGPAAD